MRTKKTYPRTFRRDALRRLAEAGRLMLVQADGSEVPVRLKASPADHREGWVNFTARDFTATLGRASLLADGSITLYAHPGLYRFRVIPEGQVAAPASPPVAEPAPLALPAPAALAPPAAPAPEVTVRLVKGCPTATLLSPRGAGHRATMAALYRLAAAVEQATPPIEGWVVQVDGSYLSGSEGRSCGYVRLDLFTGSAAEAERGLTVLRAAVAGAALGWL